MIKALSAGDIVDYQDPSSVAIVTGCDCMILLFPCGIEKAKLKMGWVIGQVLRGGFQVGAIMKRGREVRGRVCVIEG